MKICILGDSITSLTLAKAFINKGIHVDIFFNQKNKNQDKTRTIGISKSNIQFFNKEILNIEKFLWNIDKIEINSESLFNKKILEFQNNNKRLFSIIRNFELYNHLLSNIKNSQYLRINHKKNSDSILKKKYKLIINCDLKNELTKKYFYKKLSKDYNSYAYTAIMKHKEIAHNNAAVQIFTKNGPLAFLPISSTNTSLVYSFTGRKDLNFKKEVKKFNNKYQIMKIGELKKVKLSSINLRNYYYKNILAFGDLLHKIHPLAGQGFNMSIRDIKELVQIVQFRIDHGLELDQSICKEFEKKRKHKNYIFSNGIDVIYEFFKLESNIQSKTFSKIIKTLGNNTMINKTFSKLADEGILI